MATNKKWYSQQWNESFGMSPIWETEEDVEILGRRRIRIWRCSNIAKFNLNMCVPNLEIKFEACWMKVSSNSNEGPRPKNITGPPLCEACMCKFMLPISEKADAHWLHLQMSVYTGCICGTNQGPSNECLVRDNEFNVLRWQSVRSSTHPLLFAGTHRHTF